MPTITTIKGHCLFHPSGCLTKPDHLTIQQGIVRTATAQHVIRKDMAVVESFDVFCKATYTVMRKYGDDAVREIYLELMKQDSTKADLFTEEDINIGKRD